MADAQISRKLPNRINLSHARRLFGRPLITGAPQLDATGELQSGAAYLRKDTGVMASDVAAHFQEITDATPLEENRDPWKIRIPRLGVTSWERFLRKMAANRRMMAQLRDATLPLRTRFDILRTGRGFTDEELVTVREDLEARRLQESHNIQAERARRRIINKLTLLNKCDAVERDGRRVIRREVEIRYYKVSALAYIFYVTWIPRGVKILDLASDEVVTDLSWAVGHPVRSEIKQVGNSVIGLRYIVEIAASMGVPNLCKFSEMLTMISNSAPPLAFLVGYSEGKRLKWADLEKLPHLLGGGETRGGKSNFLHVMLCTLISRNRPDTLRLVMMDLKFDGIELRRYDGLPHLIREIDGLPSGIAVNEEQSLRVLEWALDEAERRGQMFTRAGARDLHQWNQRRPNRRLPYIIIVCDEMGQLRLSPDRKYTEKTYTLLQKLLAQGRAAGISFVAFTQAANKQVLDELTKINLPGRICFSVPDAGSSIRFVGDGSAMGLMPAGRGIFKHGTEKYLVQTPLIFAGDIGEVIANAQAGKLTTRLMAHPLTPVEIIEWALEHNQAGMAVRDVVAHFNGELDRIGKNDLERLLKQMDGNTYQITDGTAYRVLPSIGVRPRVLERVAGSGNGAPVDPDRQDSTQDADNGWVPAPSSIHRCEHCKTEVIDPAATVCAQCGTPL